jgi:hypothetical protein
MYVASRHKVDKVDMTTRVAESLLDATQNYTEYASLYGSEVDVYGLATNGTHLFLSEFTNYYISRVRSLDLATKLISTFVADPGTRTVHQGYAGDGGLATAAVLHGPSHLAYDASRKVVYVVDSNNQVVRKVNQTTGIISTFAVSVGQWQTY